MSYKRVNVLAPPLNEAHMGEFLISWCPSLPIPFDKPPLSLTEQLSQLVSRGLIISDKATTLHYLTHIGYYRLSGYALPFQIGGTGSDRHEFKPNVTFEDILDRYVFDRKLRLLAMDALERIEISVRAALSNTIAANHGAHWYINPNLFKPAFNHSRLIEEIKQQIGHNPSNHKRRDTHIDHYYKTYSTPGMPPSWMVFESVAFGTISFTCKNLACPEFVDICRSFSLAPDVFTSWLHSLTYIRNICAHHGRLWNRECRIKPMIARAFTTELTPNSRLYAQLVVMQILLKKIAPNNHWAEKLRDLLTEHPSIPLTSMGFPADWHSRNIWGLAP